MQILHQMFRPHVGSQQGLSLNVALITCFQKINSDGLLQEYISFRNFSKTELNFFQKSL